MGRREAEQTQQGAPATDTNLERTKEKVQENSTPEMDPDASSGICHVSQNVDPKYEERNGDRAVTLREQETEVTGDEYLDFGNYRQETGNQQKTINSSEGGLKSTTKAINGRRDLWTPSVDRESKLEVVKTGPLYDIRAYKGEKKPSRLYEEDEGEVYYELPPENLSPEKAKELEEERQEIIKSQAMKKSTTIAEKVTSVDERGPPSPALPSGEKAETKRSDSVGFAVCFDKPPPGWVKTVIDPENIDTEQINFAAARQQFLALEKSNPNLLLGPRKQVMSPRLLAAPKIYERERQGHPAVLKDDGDPDGSNQRESGLSSEKAALGIPQRRRPGSEERAAIYQDFSGENLDLGETGGDLRTEVHNGRLPRMKSGNAPELAGDQDPAKELEARDETPIEREIRLSMEREENLWRERGIPKGNSRDELVEIRSKPLLSSPLSASTSSRKKKDHARVSFYVQREIEQETKREEVLQKEGRLPGAYDKGMPQELGERRKVFEQEGTQLPSAHKPENLGEVQKSAPESFAHPHIANDRERIVRQDMNQSSAAAQSCSALRTRLGEEPSQSRRGDTPGPKLSSMKETAGPDAQLVLQKEHFGVLMRRTSPDDPRARRTERRPQWAAPREELYTLKMGKPRMSLLIDQEIQEALQREGELQEQRRKGRLDGSGGVEEGKEKSFCSCLQSPSSAASAVADSSFVPGSPIFAPGSPTRLPALPSLPTGRFPSESDSKTPHSLKQSPMEEEKKRRQREEGKPQLIAIIVLAYPTGLWYGMQELH
ncbi:PREDICTED: mitotic interactor and substrate of PLK1 [Gekko japonicus]|uniref:Mitotic interactor and substrate of PLK1 n=1 Tax=Gekko japonicus TaxID=146911 RepID=A0ABM1KJ28_GEKJA|nr:PREDICTED: mitotic interactor and substrate of PLK1 [Gekko japonicus]